MGIGQDVWDEVYSRLGNLHFMGIGPLE